MGLLDVLRAGVKTADTITKSIQASVEFHRFLLGTGSGTRTYVPPLDEATVILTGIVEKKQRMVRTPNGELSMSTASILFLNIAEVVAATAGEGVKVEDIVILPDGTTGPIIAFGGFVDAGTGFPLYNEIYLG